MQRRCYEAKRWSLWWKLARGRAQGERLRDLGLEWLGLFGYRGLGEVYS